MTSQVDETRLSLSSFWGLFLISGSACLIALIVYFCRIYCQYRKFSPEAMETQDDDDIEPARPRRTMGSSSFKNLIDFVDKKEADVKEILDRKSGDT